MLRKQVILSFLLAFALNTLAESDPNKRNTRAQYIAQWKDVAIDQMEKYGIPASITLAQAILESGDGNSELARGANNHFGIKCHGWEGKKVYHDDDRRNECFRKYKNAHESFKDHSLFLQRSRYQFLFDYNITDYKSWAKGLKKAGYATNPKYPALLIRLIEENRL
jgi:flagellum-specific peptidoglycan hydrolase FlgJ